MPRSLSNLIADGKAYSDDHIVAYDLDGPLSWEDFRRGVQAWQTQLQSIDSAHIAIHLPKAWEFLSCLWATWRLGKIALVSTSAFRDVPGFLPANSDDWLDDNRADRGFARGVDLSSFGNHSEAGAVLILFTSGSSGAPQLVPKTFSQLDAELAMIDSLWGEVVADSVIINMVSHHHMYGLPFGLLWPMVRGTPFYSRNIFYADPLQFLAERHYLTLVASPVQLENLPGSFDWPVIRDRITQIFSAGSPLNRATATRCLEMFAKAVTEIYGSTETGAVAWREQPHNSLWQCLNGVTVASQAGTGQLRVHSPAVDGDQWQTMADLGDVDSPTAFSLGGRVDRIVKVGGKRVSLTGVETALESHAWVKTVRLVQLAERKHRLGAVIVLTANGNRALIDQGRVAINRMLAKHIGNRVERIALPRYWRYVTSLPTNSQGKTNVEVLTDLFLEDRQSRFATIIDRKELVAGSHYQLILHIPDNLFYFAGHFPGNPILPGVVQTHWAVHYARELFSGLDDFLGLEAVKFQHIIQPGAVVTLDMQWHADREKLHFVYRSACGQHATGRILFRSEARRDN
jgi:acyl-coenzyme A synthetase/AMP-(fatty) acid ligase/3-hydroxymyristoyl/3-hydroxydecanoyl-(acyl carrier protein) dehydratase